MMTTATRIHTVAAIKRPEAAVLARVEYARVADQLRSLVSDDWTRATDCPLWDVRAVAGHTLGMLSTFTGVRRLMREMRAAQKAAKLNGGPVVDSLTAMQVAANAGLSTDDLIAAVDDLGPKAARWRAKAPGVLRWMPIKEEVGGEQETWRMGYLLDVILTRDPWMHRVDIARATSRPMVLTPEHDGRIVADAVAEWARRHGRPFALSLTGPAGGTFVAGDDGETITIDAVEFCRTVSGRAHGAGLLTQEVPF
jgi:uncharacterized protein (TIGR03083 family)